jgi:hypothetical protein
MMARRSRKKKDEDDDVFIIPPGRMMAMEMMDIHGMDYKELTPEQHARLEKEMADVTAEFDKKPKDGAEEKPE